MVDMASAVEFDRWLDDEFVEHNTVLEEAYFAAHVEIVRGDPDLDARREAILFDGAKLAAAVLDAGALPDDPVARYQLLGSVGGYLASCRRHQIDQGHAEILAPAWTLAWTLAAPLGVAPRYVFAHQCLYGHRLFTTLADERIFVTYNALGVLAYRRAAHALRQIPAMGVAAPMAGYLLADARAALDDVLRFNTRLAAELDVDRFFYNVRPYFKSYRVGTAVYRGANAGDFAGINEIDLLLGLCRRDDPFYGRILTEKAPYVPPEDQASLAAAGMSESILSQFQRTRLTDQVRENAKVFLDVCRLHAAAYSFHHHRLVRPFLVEPAEHAPDAEDLTASGPPLPVVLEFLERLVDLRAARNRPGLATAHGDLAALREAVA
jgi:Domain of unknown function (DUF1864)